MTCYLTFIRYLLIKRTRKRVKVYFNLPLIIMFFLNAHLIIYQVKKTFFCRPNNIHSCIQWDKKIIIVWEKTNNKTEANVVFSVFLQKI